MEYADFPELVVLSLKNNSIEDISIFERVKFKDIQALFLSNNNISDIMQAVKLFTILIFILSSEKFESFSL